MQLGFSKLLRKLVKYVSIYTKGTLKQDQRKTCLMILMQFSDFLYKSICCGYSFELHRQVDAIQISTHNICLYKEVARKYTFCNLKTAALLDCVLVGVCVVIRLNMVGINFEAYVDTEGPDEPAHQVYLIRTYTFCLLNHCIL